MLTPSFGIPEISKKFRKFNCSLDNAVFPCSKKGYPFLKNLFIGGIEKCYTAGLNLDFIVAPDIIAGGMGSLDFSFEWITGELKTAPSLALVVQDGMTPELLKPYKIGEFKNVKYLFVGGTKPWKMETLKKWVEFGHNLNLKIHVGQIGTVDRLVQCHESGVDSVDSQNFSRHNTWNYIRDYLKKYNGDQLTFGNISS